MATTGVVRAGDVPPASGRYVRGAHRRLPAGSEPAVSHHVWGEGTVLRPWRLATLTIAASPWRPRPRAGWIPADVAGAADDLVTLHDRIWGIVSIGPIVAHPTTD